MNSTTINCTLFVILTYLLTSIIAWSAPPQYVALATFVPASVAILLTAYNKQKVRDLFKLSSLKNCFLSFIIPIVALVLYWVIIIGLDLSFLKVEYTLEKAKGFSVVVILFGILLTFAMLIITSLGEEVGWRGYLLKNLKSQIPNFYIRAIVVGLIWAIWHIPIYTVPGSVDSAILWKDGFTFPIICTYILCVCTMSIMFTWLFEKDNSVWPVTIAHATNNFIVSVSITFTTYSPVSTSTAVIGIMLVAVSYFVVAMGMILFDKTCGNRLSNS